MSTHVHNIRLERLKRHPYLTHAANAQELLEIVADILEENQRAANSTMDAKELS